MKMRRSRASIGEQELIARYAYVLGNVPASVADHAYSAAFACLPTAQCLDIVAQLRAQLPVAPAEPPSDDPAAFAVLMRNLHARAALVGIRGAGSIAAAFITSPPVVAYFTSGVGTVTIDQHPPWVHDLAGHETAPIDGGSVQHRKGKEYGTWLA